MNIATVRPDVVRKFVAGADWPFRGTKRRQLPVWTLRECGDLSPLLPLWRLVPVLQRGRGLAALREIQARPRSPNRDGGLEPRFSSFCAAGAGRGVKQTRPEIDPGGCCATGRVEPSAAQGPV